MSASIVLTLLSLAARLDAVGPVANPWAEPAASSSPVASPGPASSAGLGVSRGYLAVAPGMFMIPLRYRHTPMYTWGVEGGYHHARARLRLQVGLQFEHTLFSAIHENSSALFTAHWLRFAPLLRLGGGDERTFGYGLLSVALDIIPRRPIYFEGPIGGDVVNVHPSLGGGVQRWIHGRLHAGGEAVLDIVSPGRRTGMTERDPHLRLRVFVGVLF